jgi:hypothetical protein
VLIVVIINREVEEDQKTEGFKLCFNRTTEYIHRWDQITWCEYVIIVSFIRNIGAFPDIHSLRTM